MEPKSTTRDAADAAWVARVVATAPAVMWEAVGTSTDTLRLRHVSAPVEALLGWSAEACVRELGTWAAVTHPDDRARLWSCFATALAEPGRAGSVRVRWTTRAGDAVPVFVQCRAAVGTDGAVEGLLGVALGDALVDDGAEIARRRLAFLAQASAELASTLDLADTMLRIASLAVPEFADWCTLRVAEGNRLGEPVVWHADPERRAWAYAITNRYPLDPESSAGAAVVFRTGRSILVPVVTDAMIAAVSDDPEIVAVARQLAARSSLTVPLLSRDGPVGVLSFVSSRPGLHYGEDDLRFAEDLGRRCAAAVENARLYAARERAERVLQQHAWRMELAAEVGQYALARPGLDDLLPRVIDVTRRGLALDAAGMDELGAEGTLRIRCGEGWDPVTVGMSIPANAAGSLSGYAAHTRDTVLCDDLDAETRFARSPRGRSIGARAGIAAPILVDGSPIGTLVGLARAPRAWLPEERAFIQTLSHLVAAAYEREAHLSRLAEEKERLAVTLRSIGDGVIATDVRGRVVLLNSVAETLTGWTQAEALGRPVGDVFRIVNQRTREPRESPVDRVLSTGAIVGLANHTALLSREGSERAIADSGAPIRDSGGNVIGVVLVFRDVTEHDRVQAELQRANTLESVGVLAGGIAHDFNNILVGITANLSLARLRLDPSDRVHQRITEAERAAMRAKELTQQLLTFAKGGSPQRKPTSIQELLRETVSFVLTGSNVRAQLSLASDAWVVEADASQISQVVQNLVLNAQQAMPEGGQVEVTLQNVVLQEPTGLPLPGGAYVKVEVIDHGVGISSQHISRVFDPFFTTKQRGSGLGLATAYAIIQKHDGHISVRSTLGAGTRFTVYLPAAPGAAVQPSTPVTLPPLRAAVGRILVMDDEQVIRDALAAILVELGFEYEVTADGTAAIGAYQLAREEGRGFDLVVLDLTVPGGMGGRETLAQLKRLDPTVRAIVSSGYSDDTGMADYRGIGFLEAMPKPFSVQDVVRVLERVLG